MKSEGFVHLLVSLWDCDDPGRREEILTCLRRNLNNPCITRIHVFLEPGSRSWQEELRSEKIETVPLEGYPSFGMFIDHANRHLAGSVVAIANADIFFDDSLELLRNHDLGGGVLALTRHNVEPTRGWTGRVWERNYGSQDAWIFRAPLPAIEAEVRLGYFGCDGLFARELQKAGVRATNPSGDIKAWHVHAARERVADLFTHPKSYFPGNVDRQTRHQFGFRCLPIEPLGRWKLYTVSSPSHAPMFHRWFLGTMQDDFEVVSRTIDQSCAAGEYMTDGWTEAVSQKIPLILEAIDAHFENGFFIFSDVDIQWLGPVQPRIRRLLAEFPDVDIFFQHDALRNPGSAENICTGFFVCKGNIRTRAFWQLVGKSMRRTRRGDQLTSQAIIRSNVIRGLKVGYLPREFWGPGSMETAPLRWSPGMFLDPPQGLLMHHANWTVGVPNKLAQLEYIDRKMRLRRFRQLRSAPADTPAVDHWIATAGPQFIGMPRKPLPPAVDRTGDSLLEVPQVPERLPGSFWGVVSVVHSADGADRADGANLPGVREYREFRRSAAGQGLKLLAVELAGELAGNGGSFRLGESDADILVHLPLPAGDGPPQKAAVLAAALARLPPDCDKVAWLDAAAPLEDDWMPKAVALLERYEATRFCAAGRAEAPGEGDPSQGSPFPFVEFGPPQIRADQAAAGSTGLDWAALNWAARRSVLVAAGFTEQPAT